jgi:hypothetical protein
MSSLRLLIVDDEPLIRQGIRDGLSATCEAIEITGDCDSGVTRRRYDSFRLPGSGPSRCAVAGLARGLT